MEVGCGDGNIITVSMNVMFKDKADEIEHVQSKFMTLITMQIRGVSKQTTRTHSSYSSQGYLTDKGGLILESNRETDGIAIKDG